MRLPLGNNYFGVSLIPLRNKGSAGATRREEIKQKGSRGQTTNESKTAGLPGEETLRISLSGLAERPLFRTRMPVSLHFYPNISINFRLSRKVCFSVPPPPTFLLGPFTGSSPSLPRRNFLWYLQANISKASSVH